MTLCRFVPAIVSVVLLLDAQPDSSVQAFTGTTVQTNSLPQCARSSSSSLSMSLQDGLRRLLFVPKGKAVEKIEFSTTITDAPSDVHQHDEDFSLRHVPRTRGPVSDEDYATEEVAPVLEPKQESAQERVNRIKSGRLTEDEKQAFLDAALLSGSRAVRLSASPTQNVPSSSTSVEKTKAEIEEEEENKVDPPTVQIGRELVRSVMKSRNSTPMSTASSVSTNVAQGGRDGARKRTRKDEDDAMKRKRKWVDSVLDPNRFSKSGLCQTKKDRSWRAIGQPTEIIPRVAVNQARLRLDQAKANDGQYKTIPEAAGAEREVEAAFPADALAANPSKPFDELSETAEQSESTGEQILIEKGSSPIATGVGIRTESESLMDRLNAQGRFWRTKLAEDNARKAAQIDAKRAAATAGGAIADSSVKPNHLKSESSEIGSSVTTPIAREPKDAHTTAAAAMETQQQTTSHRSTIRSSREDVTQSDTIRRKLPIIADDDDEDGVDVGGANRSMSLRDAIQAQRPVGKNMSTADSKAAPRGPIRMELPIVEDDSSVDSEVTRSMSLRDAMQKTARSLSPELKSKRWGIDITRFQRTDGDSGLR
jgi:hypothetical protein